MTVFSHMTPPLIIDLHAHPSMKSFFGNKDFAKPSGSKKGFNPFGMRTNLPNVSQGGVRVLWSSVYVPEKALRDDCGIFKWVPTFIPPLRKAFLKPADQAAREMLKHVEIMVDNVNGSGKNLPTVTVATSFTELQAALARNETVLVHTIEGAHVMEGDLANLDEFKARGVASITLAHFYPNGIAPPVDAVPDDMFLKKLGCFSLVEDLNLGLTALGKQAVERMYDIGMIVDLTHATPKARADAFSIPNPRDRPLVMTHVGARGRMNHPINPSDDEIRKIADTDGVVGVIFYNEWLTDSDFRKARNDKLVHVVENIKHFATVGGDQCVALGSDFDGMTDPPDDLRDHSELPNLMSALSTAGFTDAQIEGFAGGNAMRVMQKGWT